MDMSIENISLIVLCTVLASFLFFATESSFSKSPKTAEIRNYAYAIMLSLILAVLWYSAVLTTKTYDMLYKFVNSYTGQDYGDEDGKELEKLFNKANSIHQIDDATE